MKHRMVDGINMRNLRQVKKEVEIAKKKAINGATDVRKMSTTKNAAPQMSKWKLQSMQFRMAMQAGRQLQREKQMFGGGDPFGSAAGGMGGGLDRYRNGVRQQPQNQFNRN